MIIKRYIPDYPEIENEIDQKFMEMDKKDLIVFIQELQTPEDKRYQERTEKIYNMKNLLQN